MPSERRQLTREELEQAAATHAGKAPRVVVLLDDVRSRHNVGSIFRTADAFGVEKLVLCGFTPLPPHREIEKTALGATGTVSWEHHTLVSEALQGLRQQGYRLLAVEQTTGSAPLQAEVPHMDTPLAVVLGNELHGVSPEALAICDGVISLDQAGAKHSLNVSVCAGIVLWWLAGRHLRGEVSQVAGPP